MSGVLDSDGEVETVAGYRAAFDGPAPTMRGFASSADEAGFLVSTVQDWLAGGVAAGSVGVLVRRQVDQERARQALQSAGVVVQVLGPSPPSGRSAVVITTMNRAKGLEFSRVVVFGAEARVMPLKYVMDQVPVADRPAALDRERSLFYVACTRARDELVVTWSGTPSRFLPVAV